MNKNTLVCTLIAALVTTPVVAFGEEDVAFIDTSAGTCGCLNDDGDMEMTDDTRISASHSRKTHTMTLQCRFDAAPTVDGKVWKDAGFICGAVNPYFGVMMTRESSVKQSPNGNMLLTCKFRTD